MSGLRVLPTEWLSMRHKTFCIHVCCAAQALVPIPTSNLFLVRPGQPVPVQVAVNGAPAEMACVNSSSLYVPTTATPAMVVDSLEPRSMQGQPPGACVYLASSYLTPVVTSFAILPPPDGGLWAGSVLQLNGFLLTNISSNASVMVGDVPCVVQSVAEDGSSMSCLLPDMTAGPVDVVLTVSGAGAASMPGGGRTLRLTVPLRVNSTAVTPARGSFFGGWQLTVNGSGLGVLTAGNDSAVNPGVCGGSSGRCMAVSVSGTSPGPVEPSLVASSFTQAVIRLPPFVATSTSSTFQLSLQLRVFDVVTKANITTATVPVTLDRTFTPSITTTSPGSMAPYTHGNVTVTWAVSAAAAVAAGLLNATAPGATSLAAVALQPGNDTARISCASPTVVDSNLTSAQYTETLTCLVGGDMPAATYGLWLCLPSIGCGYKPAVLQVNATVSSISAVAGSTAGGIRLVITGTGVSQLLTQQCPAYMLACVCVPRHQLVTLSRCCRLLNPRCASGVQPKHVQTGRGHTHHHHMHHLRLAGQHVSRRSIPADAEGLTGT